MNKEQGKELLEIKKVIVNQFSQSDWLDLAFYLGCSEIIEGHPRLLRSLSFGDDDYEGNIISVLNDLSLIHI